MQLYRIGRWLLGFFNLSRKEICTKNILRLCSPFDEFPHNLTISTTLGREIFAVQGVASASLRRRKDLTLAFLHQEEAARVEIRAKPRVNLNVAASIRLPDATFLQSRAVVFEHCRCLNRTGAEG